MNILKLSRKHLRHYRGVLLLAFFAMMVQTGVDLLNPWFLKIAFDDVLVHRQHSTPLALWLNSLLTHMGMTGLNLFSLLVAMLLLALIDAIATFSGNSLIASIGQKLVEKIRVQTFAHIEHLPISFHKNNNSGDISARITSDVLSLQNLVSSNLNTLITSIFFIFFALVIAYLVNWHVALLMLITSPLLLLTGGSYRVRIRRAARKQRLVEGRVNALAQEKIAAIQIVQAFSNEDEEIKRFSHVAKQSLETGLIAVRLQSQLSAFTDLVGAVAIAVMIWVVAQEVLAKTITLGDFVLFITYFRSILSPMRQLTKMAGQFSKAEASAERIQEILAIQPEVRDLPEAYQAPRLRGEVKFENVSFSYTKGKPALKNIQLHVTPGMIVALVGPTGSGKSTLMSMLPRFHDPQSGSVLLDGVNVQNYTLRSLREQISFVPQEPVLFNSTIRDNIAYGRLGASDAEIQRAAEAANIHQFVQQLPAGYATVLSERGSTLSGGQRQCISIARAIIRDAPILLLDEPTSSLDIESEMAVIEALHRLMQGRTTFIIAHRFHTIEYANLIVVLQDGSVCEYGTHQQLMNADGLYARLYNLQSTIEHNSRVHITKPSGLPQRHTSDIL